jgi:putative membrane protein
VGGEPQHSDKARDIGQLAFDRTWLAHERTLMAWVRTATSMITFGFTIYKFFQFEEAANVKPRGFLTPRDFALIIISIGLFSLLLATIDHKRQVELLSTQLRQKQRSLAAIVAAVVSVFGILTLLATALRS